MPSKEEILAQIKALQEEADAMGDGDEYEIEIWNEKGAGTRLPASRGEGWLRTHFPELFPSDDNSDDQTSDGEGNPASGKPGKAPGKVATRGSGQVRNSGGPATKYFGKRPAGK